jgi:tRNA uridine 5-carbamoylmethylation protein Kti12
MPKLAWSSTGQEQQQQQAQEQQQQQQVQELQRLPRKLISKFRKVNYVHRQRVHTVMTKLYQALNISRAKFRCNLMLTSSSGTQ